MNIILFVFVLIITLSLFIIPYINPRKIISNEKVDTKIKKIVMADDFYRIISDTSKLFAM